MTLASEARAPGYLAPEVAAPAGLAGRFSYVEWGPVIAGTIGATAIAFVLLSFGSAIGLSAISPWPNAEISLTFLVILTALWVAVVQVGSLAAGGYIAGRMRSKWADGSEHERQFRDGAHGFLVWGLAVILGAWLVASTTAATVKTGVQAGSVVAAGAASGNAPSLSQDPTDFAIDYLLRPGPAATRPGTSDDNEQIRGELGRIFTVSLKNKALAPRERIYLGQLVAGRTGMSPADAEKRVDEAFVEAQAAEFRVREAADKARKSAAIAAFLAAATLLISCAAAAAGAAVGGRHRDENTSLRFFGSQRFW